MVDEDRVTWSFENNGMVVPLSSRVPKDYLKAAGASGLGVAPTLVRIDDSVSGGGVFRSSRRGKRQIVMPVVTYGESRAEVETKLRYLVRTLQDDFTSPRLVASYPDGSLFDVEVHYAGGADHQWGSGDTDGRTYCRWVLQLQSPDAYFTARKIDIYTIKATTGRGLLRPGGSLTKLQVSSTQALGIVNVINQGDVAAFPTWTVAGAGTGLVLTRQIDGAQLTYNGTTASGVIVDAKAKTIQDLAGNNLYGGLSGAPKFFTVPPGTSPIYVNVPGSNTATVVTLQLAQRRELIF